MVRANFALISECFALISECFALISECFALISECFKNIKKHYNSILLVNAEMLFLDFIIVCGGVNLKYGRSKSYIVEFFDKQVFLLES